MVAGESYSLQIVSPVATVEYQLAATNLQLIERSFGRPDPNPVTSPTIIHFQLGAAPGSPVIGSTGMWTYTGVAAPNTGTFDFDWHTATPINSQLGLLRGDLYDRLYFIDLGGYTGFTAIYAVSQYSLTQTNGVAATIAGAPPTLVTHNLCTNVVALRSEAVAHLRAAIPDFTTATYDDWFIYVTPSLAVGPASGTWIAGASEASPTTPTDSVLDVDYMNPFPGTIALGSMGYLVYSTIQLGSATPLSIAAGGRMWQQLAPGTTCPTSKVLLQDTIAIPSKATLGGVLLDTDNTVVTLDLTGPVPVTWTEASAGAVSQTLIVLYEVTNDAGKTALHDRHHTIVAGATAATLDPALLLPGHTYIITIVNGLEFANAASGDFDTITFPVANVNVPSRTFTVGS